MSEPYTNSQCQASWQARLLCGSNSLHTNPPQRQSNKSIQINPTTPTPSSAIKYLLQHLLSPAKPNPVSSTITSLYSPIFFACLACRHTNDNTAAEKTNFSDFNARRTAPPDNQSPSTDHRFQKQRRLAVTRWRAGPNESPIIVLGWFTMTPRLPRGLSGRKRRSREE